MQPSLLSTIKPSHEALCGGLRARGTRPVAGTDRYLALAASPVVAERYTQAVITYCETLQTFPYRGVCRDDIRLGLRIAHYKKRTVIAFAVMADRVAIIGVFYGGQDYEAIL